MKKILKNQGVQSFLSSLLCIVVGLLIGFVVLLIIEFFLFAISTGHKPVSWHR